MFSANVSSGTRSPNWNTRPTWRRRQSLRRRSGQSSIRSPAKRTDPVWGRTMPPRQCSRVDFPDPLRPTTATSSPAAISTETPVSALVAP